MDLKLFTEELCQRRRLEQRGFMEMLLRSSVIESLPNRELFHALLQLAVNEYGVRQSRLAEVLPAKLPVVSRWVAGLTAPPRYARALVIVAAASIIAVEIGMDEVEFDRLKPETIKIAGSKFHTAFRPS